MAASAAVPADTADRADTSAVRAFDREVATPTHVRSLPVRICIHHFQASRAPEHPFRAFQARAYLPRKMTSPCAAQLIHWIHCARRHYREETHRSQTLPMTCTGHRAVVELFAFAQAFLAIEDKPAVNHCPWMDAQARLIRGKHRVAAY